VKRGAKKNPTSEKAKRGTLQPSRDAGVFEIAVSTDPPMQPDYLRPAAIEVWQENLPRVMQTGVAEVDSDLFARYCSMEALVRKAFREVDAGEGDPPPAAWLTELRRVSELLGIAGRKSRIGTVADAQTKTKSGTFGNNGRGKVGAR
jgi:phage terminase small subunit